MRSVAHPAVSRLSFEPAKTSPPGPPLPRGEGSDADPWEKSRLQHSLLLPLSCEERGLGGAVFAPLPTPRNYVLPGPPDA